MTDKCAETLKQLPTMDRSQLQQLWLELFGKPPHPKLRRQLLVPIIAYRAQEKAYGGLKASTRDYLRKLALELENKKGVATPRRIKSGTKLLRQWHDETHEVTVTERGYLYRGSEYKTLSEIAGLITGARWSGPLFFGLKKRSQRVCK
jgi:hypothetical protein